MSANQSFNKLLFNKDDQMITTINNAAEEGNNDIFLNFISSSISHISFNTFKGLKGYTPIHYACCRGHIDIVKILLNYDESLINCTNEEMETPLHCAVYNSHIEISQFLLQFPLNINAQNNDGETALFYAARKGNIILIKLLLSHGADKEIKDKYNEKAVDHAKNAIVVRAFDTIEEQTQFENILPWSDIPSLSFSRPTSSHDSKKH